MKQKNIIQLICVLASILFATQFSALAGEPYYYPALSNLIKENNLPSSINLVDKENIFKDIYYENYFSSGNVNTTSGSLTLVSGHKLKFNLANTDVLFVANPNNNGELEKINIERVDYTMKGRKYMYNMPVGGFKYSIRSCYDIVKELATEDQLLYQCEKSVWKPRNERNSYFSQYLEDINEHYKTNINIDQQKDNYIDELKYQLAKNKIDVFESIYELYIIKPTEKESIEQMNSLFYLFTNGKSVDKYVKDLFSTSIDITITALSPCIEFPKKLVTPLSAKDESSVLRFPSSRMSYNINDKSNIIHLSASSSGEFIPSKIGLKNKITLNLVPVNENIKGSNDIQFTENEKEVTISVSGNVQWEIEYKGKFVCRSNKISISKDKEAYTISMINPTEYDKKKNEIKQASSISKLSVSDSGEYVLKPVPVKDKK